MSSCPMPLRGTDSDTFVEVETLLPGSGFNVWTQGLEYSRERKH